MSVETTKEDFLDEDQPIRGQKYVCLSFLSPEDVLKRKDLYFFSEYIKHFSKDVSFLFENLKEKFKERPDLVDMVDNVKERHNYLFDNNSMHREYEFFVSSNLDSLDTAFHEKNDFQTSIRGIKVRGTYESLKEAKNRAAAIKQFDKNFHVYVASVGCWCPWSPDPSNIEQQEFAETQLNTLMKKYKENQHTRDDIYEQRKANLVERVNNASLQNITITE